MHNIEFYSKPNCFSCQKARWHINTFMPSYTVKYYEMTEDAKSYLQDMYNVEIKTVPQIIIGGIYVGGFDELVEYIDLHNLSAK